jgi:predicted Fe-S protein YdhL (DUF1289 family)
MEETTMPLIVTDCDGCGEIAAVNDRKMCSGCVRTNEHRKVIQDFIEGERALLAAHEFPEEEIDELTEEMLARLDTAQAA